MQHEMIPLFSVPLIKMNIGEMDQMSMAWIRGLDYPSQRTGTDHSDDDLPMMNRGMKILDRIGLTLHSLSHTAVESVREGRLHPASGEG